MSFDDFIFEARRFVESYGLRFHYHYNPIFRTVNFNILCPITNEGYLELYDEDELNENSLNNFKYRVLKYFNLSRPYQKKTTINKVIFNDPATIIFWSDGTKTVVKAQDGEVYDPEKGMAMAISKKFLGNEGNYYEEFKKWNN